MRLEKSILTSTAAANAAAASASTSGPARAPDANYDESGDCCDPYSVILELTTQLASAQLRLGLALFEDGSLQTARGRQKQVASAVLGAEECLRAALTGFVDKSHSQCGRGWVLLVTQQCVRALVRSVLLKDERYDETRELLESAAAGVRRIRGRDHPWVLQHQNNLAAVLCKLGWWDEAARLFRSTFDSKARLFGMQHETTLKARCNMALVKFLKGERHSEKNSIAVDVVADALDDYERDYGRESSGAKRIARLLISMYEQSGREQDARMVSREYDNRGKSEVMSRRGEC